MFVVVLGYLFTTLCVVDRRMHSASAAAAAALSAVVGVFVMLLLTFVTVFALTD